MCQQVPPSNCHKVTVEVHKNIEALRQAWKHLDEVASMLIARGELRYINYSFYQTYGWNAFLAETYRHSFRGKPEFVEVLVDGDTKIILPLFVEKCKKRVRFLSGRIAGILNAVCPYQDDESGEAFKALLRFLKDHYGKGWNIRLQDMPRYSLLMKTLESEGFAFSERGSFHVPLADFSTYEDYLSSLGKNIYKNIRKSYNHLTTDGKEMNLAVYDTKNPPSRPLLREVWTLYYRRKLAWKHKKQSFLNNLICRLRGSRQAYNGRQTISMLRLEESRLYVLTINGKLAAFMHVYLHEGHALMPKLAIDVTYSRYSPGILMVLETLKMLMAEGVKDFDMCRGEERYKTEVGGLMEPLSSVSLS